MKVSVRIEPEAEAQVEELAWWWEQNRPAAVSLKSRLREVFNRIALAPHAAPVYGKYGGVEIRRIRVKTTPYLVYYFVDTAKSEAVIVSLWSSQRGEGPSL
ncbi:type II toxin-antitoxin system RelE/ParE family toxin [Myxococcota bacterium]|nr:type II toxin-antitoxin system RelE/ParE family toxin [Myxococcota bacterium]